MKQCLLAAFDYDLWANRLWLAALNENGVRPSIEAWAPRISSKETWPAFPADPMERMGNIFAHMLFASRLWLFRCGVDAGQHGEDIEAWIKAVYEGWKQAIDQGDPERRIAYQNTLGVPFNLSFSEIARHTTDHASYHRGQLREIFENTIGTRFPEVSYVQFFMARDAGTL